MSGRCRETEDLLGQPRARLNEAQRLTLERHLDECEACRALHAMSRAVTVAVREGETALGTAARERAIARALASPPRVAPRRRWELVVGVAVAAAALLIYVAMPSNAWVEGAGVHSFAHATVTLSDDARVRFDASNATLVLARGSVEVDVDPAPHAPFAVETGSFRAEVLGTSFHVDAERVEVRHGHVRVVRGAAQLADLHAGERYDAHTPKVTVREPVKAEPAEAEPVKAEPVKVEPAKAEPARRERVKRELAKAESAGDLLAQARAALARDALDETKRLLEEAERSARGGERAEAGTLRAELALRQRDQPGAIRAYLVVADRFPTLASGENALFAAAQLSAPDQARPLLERYLERYPQGRFAAQVRTRLRAATR